MKYIKTELSEFSRVLYINGVGEVPTDVLILTIGHSARDTFEMLLEKGFEIIPKPFSVGVRIEHPQELIDIAQYGKYAGHKNLGPAEYQLSAKIGNRTAYTFCMCPGGIVVAAASSENSIVTNGMSNFKRDGKNANSAFVVSVTPDDFINRNVLSGVEFQKKLEYDAYVLGGMKNSAPVQKLVDFVDGIASSKLGVVKPTYTGEVRLENLNNCLPPFVCDTLKKAINIFDKKLNCFSLNDALLTGVETRTSSPIRIKRGDNYESINIKGVYPAGEGAGYAGGIMSAAVDGIKAAEAIVSKYYFC